MRYSVRTHSTARSLGNATEVGALHPLPTASMTPPGSLREFATITNSVVIPPTAGKKVVITSLFVHTGDDGDKLDILDTSNINISPQFSIAARSGFVLPYNPAGWFSTDVGEGVKMKTEGGMPVGVVTTYYLV